MRLLSFLAVTALMSPIAQAAQPLIKSGDTLAFMGDSITSQGADSPSGYVHLVGSGLAAIGVKVKLVPAGISGHKSNQMLERLDRDVLSKKPNWMTLSCGVNDVWHGANGVPLEDYKKNITAIVDRCDKAGVKVILLTSTQIRLPIDNAENLKLAAYNAFLHDLAQQRHLPLADLNAAMAAAQAALKAAGSKASLTTDGVHMNYRGNEMMARGVLRAIALDDAQLAQADAAWNAMPEAVFLKPTVKISLADMEALESIAAKQNKTVDAYLNEQVKAAIKAGK
jgi:lysophospholipase L1-like esterase